MAITVNNTAELNNIPATLQNITDNLDIMSDYFLRIDTAMNMVFNDTAVYETWQSINKVNSELAETELRMNNVGNTRNDEIKRVNTFNELSSKIIEEVYRKVNINEQGQYGNGITEAFYSGGSVYDTGDSIEDKFMRIQVISGETWDNIASAGALAFVPVIQQINTAESGAQNIADAILEINAGTISMADVMGNMLADTGLITALYNTAGMFWASANVMAEVMKGIATMMPQITTMVTELQSFKSESASLTPVESSVSNIGTMFDSMATAIKNSTEAYSVLSTVMSATPFGPVTGAIVKVISVMVGLISVIKSVKSAADLVDTSEYSYDNVVRIQEIMKTNNVDRNTAVQLLNDWNSYQEAIDESEKERQKAYDEWFDDKDNKWSITRAGQVFKLNGDELRNKMIEESTKFSELGKIRDTYNADQQELFNTWKAQNQSVLDTYRQKTNANNLIQGISTDINDYLPGDFDFSNYMGTINYDLSNYAGTTNYSDMLNIANETANNTREIARNTEKTSDLIEMVKDNWEKKLIKEYTSKATTITYDLSGMQNTYNNTGQNFNPVKEVERYLKKKAAISTEGI